VLALLSAALLIYSRCSTEREIELATGPAGESQLRFYLELRDRPDALLFFRDMGPSKRRRMAQNLARSGDPRLANLIATLLESFDDAARVELSRALAGIASRHPDAVAEELSRASSFQTDAVFAALIAAGERAIEPVFVRLGSAPHRSGAVRLLTAIGEPAVPRLLAALEADDAEWRLSAAEVLGKMRARRAVPRLTELFKRSEGQARLDLMAALAEIGDPRSESLLAEAARSVSVSAPYREQAIAGLGRIATHTAVDALVPLTENDDPAIARSAISALRASGGVAIEAPYDAALKVRVAMGVRSSPADGVLAKAIANSRLPKELRRDALQACAGRRQTADAIWRLLDELDADRDGDLIEAGVAALMAMPDRAPLAERLKADPRFEGFVRREEARFLKSGVRQARLEVG
jgi:HEAT repeat protein